MDHAGNRAEPDPEVPLPPGVWAPPQLDLLDGERVAAAAELPGPLAHPATGEERTARRATAPEAVERALDAAHRLHEGGGWRRLDVEARATLLERWADAVAARAPELAVAEALDTGIPVGTTTPMTAGLDGPIRAAVAELRSGWVRTELPAGGRRVVLHRLPWGPAVVIGPWNAPANTVVPKVASALAAGCPVVLKPSEWAPTAAGLLADAAQEAELPPAALQLVHGGAEVGAALVADHRVRAVAFTGQVATGRAIAAAAGTHLAALQLELGGANPVVVRADAPVAATAAALAAGATKLNGQWCEAPRRVLVPPELVEPLVEAVAAELAHLRIGSPLHPATTFGPIANRAHHGRLLGQLEAFGSEGAGVRAVGEVPDLGGWFLAPTLVTHLPHDAALEEVFGPVLTFHPATSDAHAVALANAGTDGLAGYVFTADEAAGLELGAELRAGEVRVNGTSVLDLAPGSTQSFWGSSGIGGHGTTELFRFFCGSRIVGVDDPSFPI